MNLDAYLARIGFAGTPKPDADTLMAIHRAHLRAIPYEVLDVHLGNATTIDPGAAFDKLVTRGRGGWCYEMNGVLGAALDAIGFNVTRLSGGVMREFAGDGQIGNHLVLIVDLDGTPWLADVGFGDGAIDALPLAAGAFSQNGFDFRLEQSPDGWWRFHNHPQGGARSFDFHMDMRDEARRTERCHFLQTDPASLFVQNVVAQRHTEDGLVVLVNRTLKRIKGTDAKTEIVASADAYVTTLRETFGLDVPEAATLWPRICARHNAIQELLRQQQQQ